METTSSIAPPLESSQGEQLSQKRQKKKKNLPEERLSLQTRERSGNYIFIRKRVNKHKQIGIKSKSILENEKN